MTVFVVQTAYYGWVGGVFTNETDAGNWIVENKDKHPKDTLVVRAFLVQDRVTA